MHEAPARMRLFVPVNCGAIPENLMESEVLAIEKVLFYWCDSDRDGFENAATGWDTFS